MALVEGLSEGPEEPGEGKGPCSDEEGLSAGVTA